MTLKSGCWRLRVLRAGLTLVCMAILASGAWAWRNSPTAPVRVTLTGKAWTAVPLPALPLGMTAHDGVLWVCGADEMLARSGDQGRTWQVVHLRPGGELLFAIAFAGSDGWAMGTQGAGYRTRDDGKDWAPMAPSGSNVMGLAAVDQNHLLARSLDRVLSSSDGGTTWRQHALSHPGNRMLAEQVDLLGLTGGPGEIDKHGPSDLAYQRSWDRVAAVGMPDAAHAGALLDGLEYDGAQPYPVSIFYFTRDGGKRWKQYNFSPKDRIFALHAGPGGYQAFGSRRVRRGVEGVQFVSADGTSWSAKSAPGWTFTGCRRAGCLAANGRRLGWVDLRSATPAFWTTEPALLGIGQAPPAWWTGRWAAVGHVMCLARARLECIGLQPSAAPKPWAQTKAEVQQQRTRLRKYFRGLHLQPSRCISCPLPLRPGVGAFRIIYQQVVLDTTIGLDGRLHDLTVESAPSAALAQAALSLVSQWRYTVARINGKPSTSARQVVIRFH